MDSLMLSSLANRAARPGRSYCGSGHALERGVRFLQFLRPQFRQQLLVQAVSVVRITTSSQCLARGQLVSAVSADVGGGTGGTDANSKSNRSGAAPGNTCP